jgi:hypothetical protein
MDGMNRMCSAGAREVIMAGLGDHVSGGYGHDGWDPPEDYGQLKGGGAGGGGRGHGPLRFKLPEPDDNPIEPGKAARKRVMIISVPFYLWEHSTYKWPKVPRGIFSAICRRQNSEDKKCAACDVKRWPSYAANFTVIDMGFVRYGEGGQAELFPDIWKDRDGKRRESQFSRRLMSAKKGGKDKPGMLSFFEDQRNRRGDLVGCVFDCLRKGRKEAQIGETWEFVERVGRGSAPTIDEMKDYLRDQGATDEQVDREHLFDRITIQDMEEGCLFSNEELAEWAGDGSEGRDDGHDDGRDRRDTRGTGQGEDRKGSRSEGAGYGGSRGRSDSDWRGGPRGNNW